MSHFEITKSSDVQNGSNGSFRMSSSSLSKGLVGSVLRIKATARKQKLTLVSNQHFHLECTSALFDIPHCCIVGYCSAMLHICPKFANFYLLWKARRLFQCASVDKVGPILHLCNQIQFINTHILWVELESLWWFTLWSAPTKCNSVTHQSL